PHITYLMCLLLPRSTLFPYTTLFRSTITINTAGNTSGNFVTISGVISANQDITFWKTNTATAGATLVLNGANTFLGNLNIKNGTDRKSTRLNSSHVSISYAVFCLKKK